MGEEDVVANVVSARKSFAAGELERAGGVGEGVRGGVGSEDRVGGLLLLVEGGGCAFFCLVVGCGCV